MEKHILLFPHNNYISARLVAYNKFIIEYNITCNPDRMFFYYKKQVGIQLKITASTKSLKSFFLLHPEYVRVKTSRNTTS